MKFKNASDMNILQNAFNNDERKAPILSCQVFRSIIESLADFDHCYRKWNDSDVKNEPVYTIVKSEEDKGTVKEMFFLKIEYGRKTATQVFVNRDNESMRCAMKNISHKDLCLLVFLMAQQIKAFDEGKETFDFSTDQFLDTCGIKKKTKREGDAIYSAGHRPEDRQSVVESLGRLEKLFITVKRTTVFKSKNTKGKGKEPIILKRESPLFLIHTTYQDEKKRDRGWEIRFGEWAFDYLKSPRQVAYVMEKVLQYELKKEAATSRIGIYTLLHGRVNAKNSDSILLRKVGTIINGVGMKRNIDNPSRTRVELERSLDNLVKDGIIRSWKYKKSSMTALPRVGWQDIWNEWVVEIYVHSFKSKILELDMEFPTEKEKITVDIAEEAI